MTGRAVGAEAYTGEFWAGVHRSAPRRRAPAGHTEAYTESAAGFHGGPAV